VGPNRPTHSATPTMQATDLDWLPGGVVALYWSNRGLGGGQPPMVLRTCFPCDLRSERGRITIATPHRRTLSTLIFEENLKENIRVMYTVIRDHYAGSFVVTPVTYLVVSTYSLLSSLHVNQEVSSRFNASAGIVRVSTISKIVVGLHIWCDKEQAFLDPDQERLRSRCRAEWVTPDGQQQ
jgi:hypothetical protein